MTDGFRDRIARRLEWLGWSKVDLRKQAGFKKTSSIIHDIFNKPSSPSVDNFARIADALGQSMEELYHGDDRLRFFVDVAGRAHEGEMWTQLPQAQQRVVPVELFKNDLVGLEIDDDSFKPRYMKGDCIIGVRQAGTNLDNLIGLECIVQTAQGDCFIRFLQRGSKIGTYTLRGHDPSYQDVSDVKLSWAAPVRMVLRNPN